eukprot:TRINITY_DN2003_c0_g1_i7.p1 TRINITY_DN2003_c0_g1~~TRINITY_DN2003_c0_g1_i7.p1  ORF type:complete len:136 (-),score=0.75 TRINITY_DN2003_c0_g1_i7:388-795(-)
MSHLCSKIPLYFLQLSFVFLDEIENSFRIIWLSSLPLFSIFSIFLNCVCKIVSFCSQSTHVSFQKLVLLAELLRSSQPSSSFTQKLIHTRLLAFSSFWDVLVCASGGRIRGVSWSLEEFNIVLVMLQGFCLMMVL